MLPDKGTDSDEGLLGGSTDSRVLEELAVLCKAVIDERKLCPSDCRD